MKTLRLVVAAALVGAFAALAPTPAQAYPGVDVTVSEATVVGGTEITITATVDPPLDCEWELTFLGDTRTGSGSSITRTFDTPEVDEVEQHEAVATCTFDDSQLSASGGGGKLSLGTSVVTAEQSSTGSGTQTLLPLGDDDDDDDDDGGGGDGDGDGGGLLPNTGGERLAWLIIGALLVVVGGGVVLASRRRDA